MITKEDVKVIQKQIRADLSTLYHGYMNNCEASYCLSGNDLFEEMCNVVVSHMKLLEDLVD